MKNGVKKYIFMNFDEINILIVTKGKGITSKISPIFYKFM